VRVEAGLVVRGAELSADSYLADEAVEIDCPASGKWQGFGLV
jgi:hypothetical protein